MVVISILILLLINAAYSATIVLITKNTAKFPQAPSRASSNNIRSGGMLSPPQIYIFEQFSECCWENLLPTGRKREEGVFAS